MILDMNKLRKDLQPESLSKAKKVLKKIASETKLQKDKLKYFALYQDLFYINICRPYIQYEKVIVKIKKTKGTIFVKNANNVEKVLINTFVNKKVWFIPSPKVDIKRIFERLYRLIVLTLVQVLLMLFTLGLSIFKRRKVLVMMSDVINKKHFWDIRLAGIFKSLEKKNIPFYVGVRSFEQPKKIVRNYFLRWNHNAPGIYVDGIKIWMELIEDIFRPFTNIFRRRKNLSEKLYARYFPLGTFTLKVQVWFITVIYWLLGLKTAFIGALTQRALPEFLATKNNHMEIVGMIHGVPMKDYNLWEYFEVWPKNLVTGMYDKYGAWSEPMRKYFLEQSHVHTKEEMEVSGYIRGFAMKNHKRAVLPKKPKILWICEPSFNPREVIEFLRVLIKNGYVVGLSKKPVGIDKFYVALKKQYPKEFKQLVDEDGSVYDNAPNYDILIGTHSTAVFDGLLFGKRFLLLDSPKWGDVFEFKTYFKLPELFIEKPDQLVKAIEQIHKVPDKTWQYIQDFYYNKDKKGGEWVGNQIKKWLK